MRAPDGQPYGPLRAWPGGLAIARCLGDADCLSIVSPQPATRTHPFSSQSSILIVASDGVWDMATTVTVSRHPRRARTGLTVSLPPAPLIAESRRGLGQQVRSLRPTPRVFCYPVFAVTSREGALLWAIPPGDGAPLAPANSGQTRFLSRPGTSPPSFDCWLSRALRL